MRVVWAVAACLASITFASPSLAQRIPPSWKVSPAASSDDFPSLAVLLGIDGLVILECTASVSGHPENCGVRSESPEGLGFGDRALEIVRRGTLNPATRNGRAQPSRFRVAIPFETERPRRSQTTPWRGPMPTPAAMAAADRLAQQLLAQMPDPFMPEIEAPEDRRALIESWFRQESPSATETRRIFATLLARNIAEADLQAMSQGRPPVSKTLPDREQMMKSALDLFDPEAVAIKVRARYCARFGCEITPPSPAG